MCLHPNSLGVPPLARPMAMRIRARLCPQVVLRANAYIKVDLGLGIPVHRVVGVNGPARGTAGNGQGRLHLEHVAKVRVLVKGLAAAGQDVTSCTGQRAVQRLGLILGTGTDGVSQEPLALLGVDDLELEGLAGSSRDGSGVDAELLVFSREKRAKRGPQTYPTAIAATARMDWTSMMAMF